jgi:Protein of unknown function (DUF4054)
MPLSASTGDVSIGWDDVVGLAPELVVLTAVQQQICLNTCQDEITLANFGAQERVDRAALYYAAHIGTGMRLGLWGGPLTGVTTGQVNKQFKQRQASAWPLDQTKYGMEYERLCRLFLPRFALGY